MNAARAYAHLRQLEVPFVTTADAAALFHGSIDAAQKTMTRLSEGGLVRRIRRGLWSVAEAVSPYAAHEFLSAPYLSYLSLHTALYLQGMISQIPAVIYAVTLGRSRRLRTAIGTFSFHHVAPELFFGFEQDRKTGAKIATPEKALVDVLYLSGTKGQLFGALPELEIPKGFRASEARRMVRAIPSERLRTTVARRLETALFTERSDS